MELVWLRQLMFPPQSTALLNSWALSPLAGRDSCWRPPSFLAGGRYRGIQGWIDQWLSFEGTSLAPTLGIAGWPCLCLNQTWLRTDLSLGSTICSAAVRAMFHVDLIILKPLLWVSLWVLLFTPGTTICSGKPALPGHCFSCL